jgi:hypothetical protein
MRFQVWAAAIAVAVALTGGAPAWAQDERAALAREAVTLMQMEEAIQVMFDTMSPMMAASMGPELRLSVSEQARLGEILAEEFRSATPEFVDRLAGVYANNMSEQQLRDVVTFLRSPAGVAWMQTQNNAERELERIGQEVGMRVAVQAITRLNAERAR